MIHVTIFRRSQEDQAIEAYQVEGHAEFDVPGKDLVCAAVSAITVGTVNSVESLTGVVAGTEMEKGWLDVILPLDLEPGSMAQVQLILESMIVMLQTIAVNYSEYIAIHTTYNEGG
ncbi:ribosomal-processing cysteine protease Prp [Paenibacillus sp. FJAT-26967]|uniref:ribosomal-processing cysteine protease Prp n=1 Tax=Paenibacillus sp. FJAT-26967 TaxID=1729690 RepID=UPI0008398468|nr:ribosomal-processing cysteine protease Prp [Paenibacillus sp. FJAT-26967]